MARRATLVGDARLRQNIAKLSRAYSPRAMDIDMEAALEPMRRETERNARPLRDFVGKHPGFPQPSASPKGGHLDEGVASAKISGSTKRRTWWVAFKGRARKIAHLVEFGTAPHWQPKFRGGWMHPGARPRSFFRPAFDSTKSEVLSALSRRAWARLQAAATGLGRRR